MKIILSLALLITGSLFAQTKQTFNVDQIRPSTTNSDVLTTVSGHTVWAPPSGGGGGGCSTGGIPTTNGSVTGDTSSTNCGFDNRIGDTAGSNALVQSFGSQLLSNNSGTDIVALGVFAGDSNTGDIGVFIGDTAGFQNTGQSVVLVGNSAGSANTGNFVVSIGEQTGSNNRAQFSDFIGDRSGFVNAGWTGGPYLDCMGYDSCNSGTGSVGYSGSNIVGIGAFTAGGNNGASDVVAIGDASASFHSGSNIIGIGDGAGNGSSTTSASAGDNIIGIGTSSAKGDASNVVGIGQAAAAGIYSGSTNTGNHGNELVAIGDHALVGNNTGTDNIGIGTFAGANGWTSGSLIGNANTTGSFNVWIGSQAGPSTTSQLSNTIAIGHNAANTASNQTVIGNHSTTQAIVYGLPWSCQPGYGDGASAIGSGSYFTSTCYNDTGVTLTLSGFKCFTDNSGTSTMNVTNSSNTALLTGAVTCSSSFASGTQSGTVTIAPGDYMKFTFVADGTSKQATFVITGHQS